MKIKIYHVFIGGLFLIFIWRVSFLFFAFDNSPQLPENKLAIIEHDTKLNFPTNSVVSNFVMTRDFIDLAWLAKVQIPDSSLDELIKSIKKKHLVFISPTGRRPEGTPPSDKETWLSISANSPSQYVDWWEIKEAFFEQYFFDDYLGKESAIIRMVFSREDEDFVTLYIDYWMIN